MSQGIQAPALATRGHIVKKHGVIAPAQFVEAKDPVDITPVKDAFKKRVEDILEADPKAKIIVWAGEMHGLPVTKLIQPALIETLEDTGVSAIKAMEIQRSRAIDYAHDVDFDIPCDWADKVRARDPLGVMHNIVEAVDHWQVLAPHTIDSMHRYYAEHSVQTFFTDASRYHNGNTLFACDPLTKEAFNKVGIPHQQTNVLFSDSAGMAIRNHTMVSDSGALLENEDVGAVVQMCGMAHLFGQRRRVPYETSLAKIFKNRAKKDNIYDIKIAGLSQYFKASELPSDSQVDNTIIVSGLHDKWMIDRTDEEISLIRSVKGIPDYFRSYEALTRAHRAQLSCRVYDFFQAWEREEQENGQCRVRNRRPPAIF